MNKSEFLFELRKKLKRLPFNEIENAVSYYDEYISDAGPENEHKAIEDLGSPSSVASKIIGEYAVNDAEQSKKKGIGPLWVVILAVFASPIALPIAFSVAIVAIVLIFTLFIVFFSIGISAVALLISGIVSIVAGILNVVSSPPTGLFCIGYGIFVISAGALILIGIMKLSKTTFLGIQKLLGKFLIRRGNK